MQCQICQRSFNTQGGLHLHVSKTHNFSQGDYHNTFNPRFDKYDGELISYKSLDQYLKTDFNCRENFLEWFTENYQNPATKEYCLNKLKERADRKNYYILPSQFELKSLMLPSIIGFERLYGNLNTFLNKIKSVGLISRFDYSLLPKPCNDHQLVVVQDTREQCPLHLNCETKVMKVPCGDYFPQEPYYSNVFIERKSLGDLAGTLGLGKERFVREVEKAKSLGFYLVVLIEDLYSDILGYTSTNKYSKKMTGSHLMHEIRELSKFDNIQFVCSGTRKRAADILKTIFRLKDQVKILDLELAKDRGVI